MKTLADFLAMGGYARFVWPAYGFAALTLGWMIVDSVASYRRRQRELLALERQRATR